MQSQRLFLIIIALVAIFLAVGCLNMPEDEAYSVPFAVVQQEPKGGNISSELALPAIPLESGFDRKRFEEISEVLTTIETGRATLHLIEAYDVDVVFESGKGSRFNPNTNQITVDSNVEYFAAALILIHEITHARYFHEGSIADIHLDERETYALKKVEEEMVAVVSNIEAKMELAEAGIETSDIQSALYYPYRQAYGSAIRSVKWDQPGADDETLQAIGRAAGRLAVLEALMNGEAVTSNTQESYMDCWGSEWDKKHDVM